MSDQTPGQSRSPFRVEVELAPGRQPRWHVSFTSNGTQWQTLAVTFADENRAHRVAEFLRGELRPEVDREWREIEAVLR